MNLSFLNSVPEFFSTILGILFAISIHEFGHAFVAYLNGDDTAKRAGRMNINPMSHIDPFGMLMMFLVHFGHKSHATHHVTTIETNREIIPVFTYLRLNVLIKTASQEYYTYYLRL